MALLQRKLSNECITSKNLETFTWIFTTTYIGMADPWISLGGFFLFISYTAYSELNALISLNSLFIEHYI